MNKLRTASTAIALTLTLQHGHAQSSRAEDAPEATKGNWYQIHLAIFGHRSETGEYEEVWRNKLQLKYPSNLIRLKTRERYLADLCGLTPAAEAAATSGDRNRLLDILERVDSGSGYQPEEYPEPPRTDDSAALNPACKEVRPDLFPPDKEEIANDNAAAVVASAESLLSDGETKKPAPAAQLTPYVLAKQLSDEEFAGLVKKLSGAYRYRLLFSGSWPQALQPRDKAAALLIEGGDPVGQHHELEGYIRVGLERYLHVDTDLWLSRFSAQRPSAQSYAYDSPGNDYSAARQTPAVERGETAPQRRSEFPALPIAFPMNDSGFSRRGPRGETRGAYSEEGIEGDYRNDEPARPSSNLDVLAAEDSSYFVDRTVVMRQNRRMRSGEVHYLDHPMFGVLIKITPIATTDKNASNELSQR